MKGSRMTSFCIAGSMSDPERFPHYLQFQRISYSLELQIRWAKFWERVWSNESYYWSLTVKILGRLMWREEYFWETFFYHWCFFSVSYLCCWYLKKVDASYKWGKKEYKVNHLLFMDDLKLFSKNEEQMNTIVRTVYVFSTNITMEFRMKKCGILTTKIGK